VFDTEPLAKVRGFFVCDFFMYPTVNLWASSVVLHTSSEGNSFEQAKQMPHSLA